MDTWDTELLIWGIKLFVWDTELLAWGFGLRIISELPIFANKSESKSNIYALFIGFGFLIIGGKNNYC